MIRADDGTSICDPENLLLDKAEFFVVGRSSEELGDLLHDIHVVLPGGMGMTVRDFNSQTFRNKKTKILSLRCVPRSP